MKNIAVVYAGCGNKDGAEITEVVSILINLQLYKAIPHCFSLNIETPVFNHLTREQTSEKRNMLTEAARISRGNINSLEKLEVKNYDSLIIAGGFGAALHFSNWAEKGHYCHVNPEIHRIISQFYEQEKPIGAVCIAPVLLAKVLGEKHITITLGPKDSLFDEVQKTGAIVQECPVTDYITDRDHRILSTPAFMFDSTFDQVFLGIQKMIKELVEMS